MFNTAEASKALYTMLRNAPTLHDIQNISYGEFTNDNMMNVPWIGVYRGPVAYVPWSMPNGWKVDSQYRVIVEEGGMDSGSEVEGRLESLINKVLDIVSADKTLSGKVSTVKSIDIEYSYWNDGSEQGVHFQRADIVIKAETRA